jgi:hypothetical protein
VPVGVPGDAEETVAANTNGSGSPTVTGLAEEFKVVVVAGSDAGCTVAFSVEMLVAELPSPP